MANVNDKIEVQADQRPGVLILRIIGNASVDQIDELDRQLRVLTAAASELIVLDLSAMPYISSMGIGSLLRFRNAIDQTGGRVVVAAPTQQVAEAFRLGNIDRVLPTHASVDAAMNK